ncbi:MAG TPA: hypothetical protein VGL70_00250 [Candidatus Binatia bacterium]|jgi:hypothetical protein
MIDHVHVLERISLVAPLGVRFWDGVSGHAVSEGLTVRAHPKGNPARSIFGFPNRSGTYVLTHVPGLSDIEQCAGDKDFWENPPPKLRPFVVEVTDNEGRFQPFAFTANLPVRGLFAWEERPMGSPLAPVARGVPLFSAPARSAPGGMAVIRADLWDLRADQPAPWALLEARMAGQPPVRGLADRQGRVALIFPYPEPLHSSVTSPPGSPPGSERRPLFEQTWPIQLHAFYSPGRPSPRIPQLDHVLNQAPATVVSSPSPPIPLTEVSLQFGKELIVKSQSKSALLIIPAGSPP